MPKYDPMFMAHFAEGYRHTDPLETIGAILRAANDVAKTSKSKAVVGIGDAGAGFRLALQLLRANPEAVGQLAALVDAEHPNVDKQGSKRMLADCLRVLEGFSNG